MNLLNLETWLNQLGFSNFEAKCLVYLIDHQKAATKDISKACGITYNMTKVMLGNLERRKLVTLEPTVDQDQYRFIGNDAFVKFLQSEKATQIERYDQVIKHMTGESE